MSEVASGRYDETYRGNSLTASGQNEASASGVSWSAVFAGAAATAALALILLSLGTGLGLSSVSVFSNAGASGSAIGTAAILWLIFMEIASSSMGGYLAGRLRTKWTSIHTDEVYFRDTAHGFLAWSVALVVTAAFLGSAATSLVGSSVDAKPSAGSQSQDSISYFADSMMRTDAAKPEGSTALNRSEVGIILAHALRQGELAEQDQRYLDQLVITNTGLAPNEADKRVTETFAAVKQATEMTRKAIAHTLLWAFLALLVGAFCASFSATIGGRQRDSVKTI